MYKKHLFSAYYGLFVGAKCSVSVWNGRLTELTKHLLFTLCSWFFFFLIISSLCCITGSDSWLTTEKQITVGRGSNTEPGTAKLFALFHHLHRIVDFSQQSSPHISPKDCFKYVKFWGAENFSYKLIINIAIVCQYEEICPAGYLTSLRRVV